MKTIKMREEINQINSECELINDVNKIYWDSEFNKNSVANKMQIDIRKKGRRKPVLIKLKNETIIIEWDYGQNQWIAHNNKGNIIKTEKNKSGIFYDVLLNYIKKSGE